MEKCKLCGAPGIYISKKFVSPLCKECAEKQVIKLAKDRNIKFAEIDDFYTQYCEEMENVEKHYQQDVLACSSLREVG